MKILIAVASRHGSTYEIAEAMAEELRTAGHAVAVQNVEEIHAAGRYEAIIIGSAVYVGDWLPEAQRYVERNRARFAGVPVWLFSSGPLGEEPQPKGNPAHLDELVATTGARGHRIFVGKLDKSSLGLGERLMARAVKAPEGDFRDWPAIRAWAGEIVSALESIPASAH